MSVSPNRIKGMSDIFSPEVEIWQMLEGRAHEVMNRFDFREVRTPIVESASVYTHSLGDTSEIVEKQMYAFETRGGDLVCLRPEGTAGVMRFVSGHLQDMQDARLYYKGQMFRAERPQAGRKRQFHQLGVECIGAPSAAQDAEVIALQAALFEAWGLKEVTFQINTRGSLDDFPKVLAGLRAELEPSREQLCEDCQRKLESNVLRILDCKKQECKCLVADVPSITSWMAPESVAYFEEVKSLLTAFGVSYEENPLLVRGLDYYQHTIWEVTSTALGAQDALAGGGRYVMSMGGKSIEGVGFGIGLERVIMALPEEVTSKLAAEKAPLTVLISLGEAARNANVARMSSLRAAGVRVRMDLAGKSMKAQMKAASRHGARYTVVVGESEVESGSVQLKDMERGEQREIANADLLDALRPV